MLSPVRSLDATLIWGHFMFVKTLLLLLLITLPACGQKQEALTQVPPRNIVPMEVKQRAQAAVKKVMEKTMRGDFKAALDSMNPEFIKVSSRAVGGPEKYKANLLKMMNQMGANGITFEAAITQAADIAFEVDFGLEEQVVNGEVRKIGKYRQWMVFVPTVKDFEVTDPNVEPATPRKFRKWGFEIAISPKGNEDWTFINGDNINALQLRKIFPFLPKDDKALNFPSKKIEERPKKK